jgi:hypothetical protein
MSTEMQEFEKQSENSTFSPEAQQIGEARAKAAGTIQVQSNPVPRISSVAHRNFKESISWTQMSPRNSRIMS